MAKLIRLKGTVAQKGYPGDEGLADFRMEGGKHDKHLIKVHTSVEGSDWSETRICFDCMSRWGTGQKASPEFDDQSLGEATID